MFGEKQPDLNWDNPKVREEVADICNYWFELGVDGFRCDVITYISKKKELPNGKPHFLLRGDEHFILGEKIHEYLNEIYERAWKYRDSLIVGEAVGIDSTSVEAIIKEERNELDSAISFELMEVDMKMNIIPSRFDLVKFKQVINKWQNLPAECWNTIYYENHDQPRSVSRYGNAQGTYTDKLAEMLAVSLHLQRGTSYIYQGEEIGMTNCPFEEDDYKDVASVKALELTRRYAPFFLNYVKKVLSKRARDNARTPMQWNSDNYAGFSDSAPWMKINPNYTEMNVESQERDSDSVLNFYKKLIAFRQDNDIIINGDFKLLLTMSRELFVFERTLLNKALFVICNFTQKYVSFTPPEPIAYEKCEPVIQNYKDAPAKLCNMLLRPYECIVYQLSV